MAKKKVLIIDDEVDFCLLMQFYLQKKNCDVSISHTLSDGLGSIQNKIPDIVILDNNLPDGLGWPHARSILKTAPDVQLFLISANKPLTKDIIEEKDEKNENKTDKDDKNEKNGSHFHIVEKPISISQIDKFLS
jgi:DNA-binding NtrC family response regulator